jgi:uncharacterized Zn-binding protein involved in type VI secretion
MAFSVGINPPKTPVTKGSKGVAKATLPNVCKMPGPPAPFVPSPLPNTGKSELSPKDYSTTVKIEGNAVAIRGATFESFGDMASKGTGGGLISANTHGPTKFITPGSLTVKIEGKSVHLLGEPMLNNCGPSGTPPNTGATMAGESQDDQQEKVPCTHPRTRRDPPADLARKLPKNQVKEMQSELNKMNKRADKMRAKLANVAGTKAAAIQTSLDGLEDDIRGREAERQVAQDELEAGRLLETRVKIVCAVCGNDITDLDVITTDAAKEVKAGADFKEKQSILQTAALAEFFPGTPLHLAAPAAAFPTTRDGRPESVTKGWKGAKPPPQPH